MAKNGRVRRSPTPPSCVSWSTTARPLSAAEAAAQAIQSSAIAHVSPRDHALPDSAAYPAGGESAIVVHDLFKRYDKVDAVKGISFTVRRATTTALLGGNGAG